MKQKEKILLVAGAAVAGYFLFVKKTPEQVPDGGGSFPGYDEMGNEIPSSIDPTNSAAYQTPLGKENFDYLMHYVGNQNPVWAAAFKKMSDIELINAWQYVWSYFLKGRKLYSGPGSTGTYQDGGWNAELYSAIDRIRNKYHIF